MKCPKCGFENKPDAEICGLCKAVKFVRAGGGGGVSTSSSREPAAAVKKHLLTRVGAPPLVLEAGKDFTFGRHPSCSFTIPSPRVSREHAVISWEGQTPVLSDKGSSNGTFVGGKRIVGKQNLNPGDEIEVGPFACVYKFEAPSKAAEVIPTDMQTMTEQGDLLSGAIGDTGLIEVLQGLEFNTKSGTLAAFSKQGDGWLTVENGVPVAAEAGTGLKDEEAVMFLLGLKQGRFTFSPEKREKTRRIKPTITGLLLEWGRRSDETQAPGA